MARKRKKGMSKIQPSVRTLTFPIGTIGTDTARYIDLSQCASLVNRRFYRQGVNWAVAGFTLHTSAGSGSIQISKIPNTWVASGSWEKAFRLWDKQQKDAIEAAGAQSAVARFRDFKIHADEKHIERTFANNLLPAVLNSLNQWDYYATGEWEPSQVVLPNSVVDPVDGGRVDPKEVFLHMTGANEFVDGATISRGIISGYADSRAYPQSPDPVSPNIDSADNWMRAMQDVGNDNQEITDNATDKNDNLPYPQVDYPGGDTQAAYLQYHDQLNITATSVSGKTTARGTTVPCGLLKLRIDPSLGAVEGNPISWIQVHLVPGAHRGYLCEPMTDM